MSVEQHYLVGLDLTGRRVVVVGGGTVAQRRLPRLVASGASVEVIAPHVTPAVQGMAGIMAGGAVISHWEVRGFIGSKYANCRYKNNL